MKVEIRCIYPENSLYEFINKHRGLSIYEIAKKLNWSAGKVHAIVKTEMVVENSRVKRKVYPTSWMDLLPEDVR